MNEDVFQAVRGFLEAFEEVFDNDWSYTREMLGIRDQTPEQKQSDREMGLEVIPIISDDGTFLRPQVDDESEHWGHRGMLLERYRTLKRLIQQRAK